MSNETAYIKDTAYNNSSADIRGPAGGILTSAATTISALPVDEKTHLVLSAASAITLNSLLLTDITTTKNIFIAFTGNVILTIKHNVPAGGIPFMCPNLLDYVIAATNRNRIYTITFVPGSGLYVS
jgi:hypothetical protein